MRATIIDANGDCFDLGDIEITAETTLNDLAGGREIAMPAVLVSGDLGALNFTDTPAPTRDGPFFRPDEADRFPASTYPPSGIVTVKSLLKAMQTRTSPQTLDQWLHEHRNPLESRGFKFALPEPARGWPDPNRRGAGGCHEPSSTQSQASAWRHRPVGADRPARPWARCRRVLPARLQGPSLPCPMVEARPESGHAHVPADRRRHGGAVV